MKKEKKEKIQDQKVKKQKKYHDKGQIFIKVMAGFLAILMIVATASTLIYSLMK